MRLELSCLDSNDYSMLTFGIKQTRLACAEVMDASVSVY